MKVLLLSNQGMVEPFVGNPIMLRMRDALLEDDRIEDVKMLRCHQPFKVASELRALAKSVDVIHVHFGGMYALLTWILLLGIKRPKFITFHGTDIHAKAIKTSRSISEKIRIKFNQYASFVSILCYTRCGFVAKEMEDYVPSFLNSVLKKKSFVQPLGVDYKLFTPMDKTVAQDRLSLEHSNYILFSDVHNTTIKRRDTAQAIIDLIPGYKMLILCGVNPNEVPVYINACDCVLLTSDQEGSPNIIREALSLNRPVFSVDVGDAKKQLQGLQNSYIIPREPENASRIIMEKLSLPYVDNSRETRRELLCFSCCSKFVISLYNDLKEKYI